MGNAILERHYSAKQKAKDDASAAEMSRIWSPAIVFHHDEFGVSIISIEGLIIHEGATRIVQKYGRLYVMQLIRWLSTIISELAGKGGIEALFGLDEPFHIFCNNDRYLLRRKTWSIYRL